MMNRVSYSLELSDDIRCNRGIIGSLSYSTWESLVSRLRSIVNVRRLYIQWGWPAYRTHKGRQAAPHTDWICSVYSRPNFDPTVEAPIAQVFAIVDEMENRR